MDRALKERIIGITVLVVFAVVIVPVFLDGPSDDSELVSETLTLPGQNPETRKQQTIVLDRNRSEPVPAPSTATPAQKAPVEEKTPAPPQPSAANPDATAQPAVSTPDRTEPVTSETGMWAVQLGSFSNQANAERLAAELRKQDYAAFLSQLKTANGSLHRVRIGPLKDRDSAEAVAAKLKTAGHTSQVVPHP